LQPTASDAMKITGFEAIGPGEFPNLLRRHIHTDEGLIGLGETEVYGFEHG
jgi:L-alanine-DL-glutamate epimerase-like enolase superfamily enzyme